jgi:hypothetical protein
MRELKVGSKKKQMKREFQHLSGDVAKRFDVCAHLEMKIKLCVA